TIAEVSDKGAMVQWSSSTPISGSSCQILLVSEYTVRMAKVSAGKSCWLRTPQRRRAEAAPENSVSWIEVNSAVSGGRISWARTSDISIRAEPSPEGSGDSHTRYLRDVSERANWGIENPGRSVETELAHTLSRHVKTFQVRMAESTLRVSMISIGVP